MSPRRKIPHCGKPFLRTWRPQRQRQWALPLATAVATVVASAAITVCAVVLNSHEMQRRTEIVDAEALGYVRSFMTEFTSPDPFHANDYADRILAHATGDFAEDYQRHQNEILIGVARSEPTTGSVLEAAVSGRNDDGGVDVMVVTKLTATSTDGKLQVERANRWIVTTRQESDQWKISSLNPLI